MTIKSVQAKVLISLSSTVGNSIGVDLSDHQLLFFLNENTGEMVINIVNNKTGEIIRQASPSEIFKVNPR